MIGYTLRLTINEAHFVGEIKEDISYIHTGDAPSKKELRNQLYSLVDAYCDKLNERGIR